MCYDDVSFSAHLFGGLSPPPTSSGWRIHRVLSKCLRNQTERHESIPNLRLHNPNLLRRGHSCIYHSLRTLLSGVLIVIPKNGPATCCPADWQSTAPRARTVDHPALELPSPENAILVSSGPDAECDFGPMAFQAKSPDAISTSRPVSRFPK